MADLFRSGLKLRWLNNAGFEVELPGGKHLFVDPWLDTAEIWPVPLDALERMDYVLLTHTHFDHADSLGSIQKKFPDVKIFMGDLACDAMCRAYHLNVEKVYRMRGGECYQFDDVKIEAITARHTESRRGNYADSKDNLYADGTSNLPMWFGWMEMLNYRITAADGSTMVIWGGMTSEEQCHRMSTYRNNDIAVMHVSPKQDPWMFGRLVNSIGAKVVIPHHYDLWETMFAAHPEMLKDSPLPPDRMNEKYILGMIRESLEFECPYASFCILEHHKWYRFGLAMAESE